MKNDDKYTNRMLHLKVVARTTEDYHKILNDIKLYRMVVDKALCLIHMAHCLSTDLNKVSPKKEKEFNSFLVDVADREIVLQLARLMGGAEASSSKASHFVCELIPLIRKELEHIYPKLFNAVSDELSRDLLQAAIEEAYKIYTQKDPILKVRRNKLIANYERPLPNVSNIGMKVLRFYDPKDPKYGESRVCCGVTEENNEFKIWFSLGTSKDSKEKRLWLVAHGEFENKGEMQTKKLKSFLDRNLLHKMVTNKLQYCDMVFNVRDGRLTVNIPYKVEIKDVKTDPSKQLHVGFYHEEGKPKGKDGKDLSDVGKDFFIHVQVPTTGGSDKFKHYKIPVNNVIEHLKQIGAIRSRAELRKDCCMTRGLRTGDKNLRDIFRSRVNDISKNRDLFVKDNNQLWSKSIIEFAQRWSCGTIKIYLQPDMDFLGQSWAFGQLSDFIEYKAKSCGILVERIESEGVKKFMDFFKTKEEEE